MRKTMFLAIPAAIGLAVFMAVAEDDKQTFKPKEGYVPDAETAIKIAVAVWIPIYGAEETEKAKPYKATLSNGVWRVAGSLPSGTKGGVAEADIAKDDARVLRVIHGK